jgi:hypothetical protein
MKICREITVSAKPGHFRKRHKYVVLLLLATRIRHKSLLRNTQYFCILDSDM